MHKLYELKDKLLKELEEYSQNGKYSKEDVETIKYMASAVDHICNIVERAEDDEYSSRGGSYAYDGGQGGETTEVALLSEANALEDNVEFTFNGKKLARAIAAEPPLPACWTGILRLLSSMKTTNAVMSTNSKM